MSQLLYRVVFVGADHDGELVELCVTAGLQSRTAADMMAHTHAPPALGDDVAYWAAVDVRGYRRQPDGSKLDVPGTGTRSTIETGPSWGEVFSGQAA